MKYAKKICRKYHMHFAALSKFLIKRTWLESIDFVKSESESWLEQSKVDKCNVTTELGRESQLCLISLELCEIPMHWFQIQHLPHRPPALSYSPCKITTLLFHNLEVIQNVNLQLHISDKLIFIFCIFSCPEQLNRWPCHWLTDSFSVLLLLTYKEQPKTCDLWDIT